MPPTEPTHDATLPARVPLDRAHRPDPLRRLVFRLSWVAALVGMVCWAGFGLTRDWWAATPETARYMPGPVAAVHQAWESNCSACHEPFQALSGHSSLRLVAEHDRASSERCTTCHAGPEHHANEKPSLACSACHREHRGRDASLVRLADGDCTQCHAHLREHQREPRIDYADVSGFDRDRHPQFRSLAKDPGHLKFNHALHMTPGMGRARYAVERLPADVQERYLQQHKGAGTDALVVLDCSTCHRADAGEKDNGIAMGTSATASARHSGAAMLPIEYSQHCQACHPLTFERANGQSREPEVPHHLQPAQLLPNLEGFYSQALLKERRDVFDTFVPKRPLPGKPLIDDPVKGRDLIQNKVAAAEKLLFSEQTCLKCHELTDAAAQRVIVPPQVPQVWLKSALFNHAAHHAVECRSCHADAYALDAAGRPNAKAATTSAAVLVPGLDTCVECHAPQQRTDDGVRGGVRHDCVECHRYHHGITPLQGWGAKACEPERRRGIQDLLRGPLTPHP